MSKCNFLFVCGGEGGLSPQETGLPVSFTSDWQTTFRPSVLTVYLQVHTEKSFSICVIDCFGLDQKLQCTTSTLTGKCQSDGKLTVCQLF